MLSKKSVNRYFEKCLSQALEAEQRSYDNNDLGRYYFYVVVDGNYLVFNVCSPYKRVNQRVKYRVLNNFKKNFGIKAMTQPSDINRESGYTLNSSDSLEVTDKNFTRNAFELTTGNKNNRYIFLMDYFLFEDREGEHIPAYVYEGICKTKLGEEEYLRRLKADEYLLDESMSYAEYTHLFETAFNVPLNASITFHSSNLREVK